MLELASVSPLSRAHSPARAPFAVQLSSSVPLFLALTMMPSALIANTSTQRNTPYRTIVVPLKASPVDSRLHPHSPSDCRPSHSVVPASFMSTRLAR